MGGLGGRSGWAVRVAGPRGRSGRRYGLVREEVWVRGWKEWGVIMEEIGVLGESETHSGDLLGYRDS